MSINDSRDFQALLSMFATACHDPYAGVEPRAVLAVRAALIAHIDYHCLQQSIIFSQRLLDGKATQ